ncbi:MAG: methyltransferase domain-containing protein [Rhodobiaceae bacterium]|nr:methyltransferase domain-containing protein [Rhodobiaceae bacterium]
MTPAPANVAEEARTGQLTGNAAETYEDFFVPSLFGQFAAPLCAAVGIGPGDAVLDVACGTGIVARAAHPLVQPDGSVTGVDINPGMLAVARRLGTGIDWRDGRAEALPFADGSFDAVTCQFGLMFFDDRAKALAEMARVAKPGGRLAVSVWDAIETSPGYAALSAILDDMFGADIAAALHMPFVLGNPAEFAAPFEAAGIAKPQIVTQTGTARFASIDAWMHTEIRGWTLADVLDDDQFVALLDRARSDLSRFAGADGAVSFAAPVHIATVML